MSKTFWTGYKPMNVGQLINRVAASVGSVKMAELSQYADYNGHHVSVRFNDRRNYWIAEYTWAGRQVISRGSFEEVLGQALCFQQTNGASGSVTVYLDDESHVDQCVKAGLTETTDEITNQAYRSLMPEWLHNEAVSLVHLSKFKSVDFSKLIVAERQKMSEGEYLQMKGSL